MINENLFINIKIDIALWAKTKKHPEIRNAYQYLFNEFSLDWLFFSK